MAAQVDSVSAQSRQTRLWCTSDGSAANGGALRACPVKVCLHNRQGLGRRSPVSDVPLQRRPRSASRHSSNAAVVLDLQWRQLRGHRQRGARRGFPSLPRFERGRTRHPAGASMRLVCCRAGQGRRWVRRSRQLGRGGRPAVRPRSTQRICRRTGRYVAATTVWTLQGSRCGTQYWLSTSTIVRRAPRSAHRRK